MDVIEFRPYRDQYAFTFGGVTPVRKVQPGTMLRLWTDDAFCGNLRDPADMPSAKLTMPFVNPQTGPFHVEGAEPGDTLALGARLLEDRSDDPEEPLRVYADPAGHPFCIIAAV